MLKNPKPGKPMPKPKANAGTASIAKKPTALKPVGKSAATKAFEARAQKFVNTKKAQETKREQNSMYRTSTKPSSMKRSMPKGK